MQASSASGLPCPWAPLQSSTAAASHQYPLSFPWVGCMRGADTLPIGLTATLPVSPRRFCLDRGRDVCRRFEFSLLVASYRRRKSRVLGRICLHPRRHRGDVRCTDRSRCTRAGSLELHPRSEPKRRIRMRCSPHFLGRSRGSATNRISLRWGPKLLLARRFTFDVAGGRRHHRSDAFDHRSVEVASRRGVAEATPATQDA
jgi:hypothetical protein